MRFVVNDNEVDALTKQNAGHPILARAAQSAKGMVLTPEDATRAYIRQNAQWLILLAIIAIVLMFAIVIAGASYEPGGTGVFAIAGLAMAAALVAFMYFLLRYRARKWNDKLEHRKRGLAPAGTAVAIDATGLTMGAETFAWPALRLDLAELHADYVPSANASGTIDADRTHLIERLRLTAAGGRALVLDRYMISNGPILVDNVWRRLAAAAKA